MKKRPIIFSAPMVRAILGKRKTQTRRIVKPPLGYQSPDDFHEYAKITKTISGLVVEQGDDDIPLVCPYGKPGDQLWVRETFHACPHCSDGFVAYKAGGWIRKQSGSPDDGGDRNDTCTLPLKPACSTHGWKPSIHMPRWASRITLEVTGIRVERLQDISEDDAKSEGIDTNGFISKIDGITGRENRIYFSTLWKSIHGPGSWDTNPWVWVVSFRRITT